MGLMLWTEYPPYESAVENTMQALTYPAISALIGFFALAFNTGGVAANEISIHPVAPGDGPFIIQLAGEDSSSCSPATRFAGVDVKSSNEIELRFSEPPDACTADVSPYRLLIDMYDIVAGGASFDDLVRIRADLGGPGLEAELVFRCRALSTPGKRQECRLRAKHYQRVDSGLFSADTLEKQGLQVVRQHKAMALYPMIYDENGKAIWYFAGSQYRNDAYFAELFELSGGRCLDCPPAGQSPMLKPVGHISALVDGPGTLQVKINDSDFIEYRPVNFGYIELEGRWAVAEFNSNFISEPGLGEAFTLTIKNDLRPVDGPLQYEATTAGGKLIGELSCFFFAPITSDRPCVLNVNGNEYQIGILSPDTLIFETNGPIVTGGGEFGTLVRVD